MIINFLLNNAYKEILISSNQCKDFIQKGNDVMFNADLSSFVHLIEI